MYIAPHMHLPRIVFFAVALLMPVLVFAQAEKKAPWLWTDEERLAARFDEAANQERIATARSCRGNPAQCHGRFVFEGSRNPELLMPWELMVSLTGAFDDHDRQIQSGLRAAYIQRTTHLNLGPDFWDRLYAAGKPFFERWNEQHRLARALTTSADPEAIHSQLALVKSTLCQLRAQAYAAAQLEFGKERFDRFLYEAVAVDSFGSSATADRALHLFVQKGCR